MAGDNTSGGSGYGDRQTAAVLARHCIDLEQRLAKLREALRVYADEDNWVRNEEGFQEWFGRSGFRYEMPWRLAQQALEETRG